MRYYADHYSMQGSDEIATAVELAKSGGRLSNLKQWILADTLAALSDTQLQQVAVESGRNESTLSQYARAAERWPTRERVPGVSFSAHRVALSWHDPAGLLKELKAKHGSPTVQQVRQAMGLEGHPGMELIERGMGKLDRQVSVAALTKVIAKLTKYAHWLDSGAPDELDEDEARDTDVIPESEPEFIQEEIDRQQEDDTPTEVWTPPVRVNDIAGM